MEKINRYLNEEDSAESDSDSNDTSRERSTDLKNIWGLLFVHEENILMVEEYKNISTNIANEDFKTGASFTFTLKDTEVRKATVLDVSATKDKIDISFSKKREELKKGTLFVPRYGKIAVASFYKHTPRKCSSLPNNILPPKKQIFKPNKKQHSSKRALQLEQNPHIMNIVDKPKKSVTTKPTTSSFHEENGNLGQISTVNIPHPRPKDAEKVTAGKNPTETSHVPMTPETMVPLYPLSEIEVSCGFLRKLEGRVALYKAKMEKEKLQAEPTGPPRKRKAAPFPDTVAKDILTEVLGDGILQLVFAGRKKKETVNPKLISAIEWFVPGLECGHLSVPLSKLFHNAKRDRKSTRDKEMQINRFHPDAVSAKLKKKSENALAQQEQGQSTSGPSQENKNKTSNINALGNTVSHTLTPLATSGVNVNKKIAIFRAWDDSPNVNDPPVASTSTFNLNAPSPSWIND